MYKNGVGPPPHTQYTHSTHNTHTINTHSTHTVHTRYTHSTHTVLSTLSVHTQYKHSTHTVHTHSTHTQYAHLKPLIYLPQCKHINGTCITQDSFVLLYFHQFFNLTCLSDDGEQAHNSDKPLYPTPVWLNPVYSRGEYIYPTQYTHTVHTRY